MLNTAYRSDSIQLEPTRSTSASENLPFSISRLLSKPFDNNNKLSHAASAAAAAAAVMAASNGHHAAHNNTHDATKSEHHHHQLLADAAAAAEQKFAAQLAHAGIPYSTASALYSYHHPLYASALVSQPHHSQLSPTSGGSGGGGGGVGQVLRVPPQRTPLSWALPPMHPAALAHQAVKDRLAGKYKGASNIQNKISIAMRSIRVYPHKLYIINWH